MSIRERREKTENERKLLASIGFDNYETNRFKSDIKYDFGNIKVETKDQCFTFDPTGNEPLKVSFKKNIQQESICYLSFEERECIDKFKQIVKLADAGYDILIDKNHVPIASFKKGNFSIEMPACEKTDFNVTMGKVTHRFPYNEALKEEIVTAIERNKLNKSKFDNLFIGMATGDDKKVEEALGPVAKFRISEDFKKMEKAELQKLVDKYFSDNTEDLNKSVQNESNKVISLSDYKATIKENSDKNPENKGLTIIENETSKFYSLESDNGQKIKVGIPNQERGEQILIQIDGEKHFIPNTTENVEKLEKDLREDNFNIEDFDNGLDR